MMSNYIRDLEHIYMQTILTLKDECCLSDAHHYFRKYQKKMRKRLNQLENYYSQPIFDEEDDIDLEYYSIVSDVIEYYCDRLTKKLTLLS